VRGRDTADWLKELELGKAKKAGSFLDGCKIYLSGFSEPDCVQLARILKYGGAARLTQLVESVTHVLHPAAESMAAETVRLLGALQLAPHHVSLEWLVESMRRGRPVSESDYPFPPPVEEAAAAGPTEPAAQPAGQDDTVNFEANLLAQYGGAKKDVGPGGGQTSTMMTETMSQVQPFLSGLTIELAGFPEQQQQDLSDWINEAEGELVYSDHEGRVDYLILPLAGGPRTLRQHRRLVSELWLEDCLDAGELVEPQYFHRPALLPATEGPGPLAGVVTCLSGYTGREREFLSQLVGALGGAAQEIFAKRDNPEKKAKGNTHLICPEGTGQKYDAAMKWRLPVVTAGWLRACLRDRAWVSESSFLVGAATTATPGRPEPSEEPQETAEEEAEETVTNMSIDEIHRSYGQQKAAVESPMASMTLASPATLVRPSVASRLATPGPADSPLATQLLRPRPINLTDITVTPQRWADSQPSPSQPGGQSVGKRRRSPGREDDQPTPKTPYGCHYTPEPSPRTRKLYKKLAGQMPRPELTELERRQAEDWAALRPAADQGGAKEALEVAERAALDRSVGPEERDRRHQEQLDLLEGRGLPVLERDDRPFDEIMEERYRAQGKSWKNFSQDAASRAQARIDAMMDTAEDMEVAAGASKELEGVTLCVAKKLASRAKELHRVVEALGGTVAWQLGDRVTHLVFTGKQNDTTKEFRAAREAGKHVVAPDWVLMCRDEARRVEEELFPHTYNPRLKLDVTGCSPPLSQSMSQTSRAGSTKARAGRTKARQPSGQAVAEEVTADLAEMESLLSSVTRTPAPASGRKVLRARLSNQEEAHRTVGGAEDQEEGEAEVEKESQVLWRDPEEEEARRKLQQEVDALETQDMAGMETMETMGSIDLTSVMDKENKRNPANFVFMLSGGQAAQEAGDHGVAPDWVRVKGELEKAITKLGGRMSVMGEQFDPHATHMITNKVSRSEKMMCCVASGLWVLHPSYVTHSMERQRWLEEDKYEWGNKDNGWGWRWRLGMAARRWRQRGGGEAFSGMKVMLVMPARRRDQVQRLVEAGGGEVVAGRPAPNKLAITHIITDEVIHIGRFATDLAFLNFLIRPLDHGEKGQNI
jgi:hypothetical protein